MGNGVFIRIDGCCSCSCKSLLPGLWTDADGQYQLVDSIPASVGFNAME
jgi:hypothetical protein